MTLADVVDGVVVGRAVPVTARVGQRADTQADPMAMAGPKASSVGTPALAAD